MPSTCLFKKAEEKLMSCEVSHLMWSPKMDLLALANIQGEVILHRLSWQKVWTLAPAGDNIKVTSLVWRPDGKVLCVGYSSGKVSLCDIENSAILHSIQMTDAVGSLNWISHTEKESERLGTWPTPDAHNDVADRPIFQEQSEIYLPKLPSFPKSYSNLSKGDEEEEFAEDAKKLIGQTDLNILLITTDDGFANLYAFGVFPVGTIPVISDPEYQMKHVLSGYLSADLQMIVLMLEVEHIETKEIEVKMSTFTSHLLATHHRELRLLALKMGQVLTHLMYLNSNIEQMTEAWDDILLEMDSKLLKFAEEKHKMGGGSVSNDFLRLLMIGIPSEELRNFLLDELTDKGLKKMGQSIETSYSSIQKLIVKYLQSVSQALLYHLSDVSAMSKCYEMFGVLGLSPDTVRDAVCCAGSFILKSSELQQVINGSMTNFKAFFRWLYVVIKSLSGSQVSKELSKVNQQDVNFVAQFLKENFTEEMDGTQSGFKLEKVGQYLKNEDLTDPIDNSNNPWVKFLAENPSLQDSELLYPTFNNQSLLQMYDALQQCVDTMLQNCSNVIGNSMTELHSYCLFTRTKEEYVPSFRPKISHLSYYGVDGQLYVYTVFTKDPSPCTNCYIIKHTPDSDKQYIGMSKLQWNGLGSTEETEQEQRCTKHQIIDVAFYGDWALAVLLQEVGSDASESSATECCPVLALSYMAPFYDGNINMQALDVLEPGSGERTSQLCLHPAVKTIECGTFVDETYYRRLEPIKASMFAVMSKRSVSCLLLSSGRRVRTYMMDAGEDDDSDCDESQNITDRSIVDTSEQPDAESWQADDEDKENFN